MKRMLIHRLKNAVIRMCLVILSANAPFLWSHSAEAVMVIDTNSRAATYRLPQGELVSLKVKAEKEEKIWILVQLPSIFPGIEFARPASGYCALEGRYLFVLSQNGKLSPRADNLYYASLSQDLKIDLGINDFNGLGGIVISVKKGDLSEGLQTVQEIVLLNGLGIGTKRVEALQRILDNAVKKGVPGVTMLVDIPGEGTWVGASGVSNLRTGEPMVPEGKFQIGSITKTFMATVVLQLAEEGKLTINDTLDQWLPSSIAEKIPYSDEITIRRLMSHTSGIYDYLDPKSAIWEEYYYNPSRKWEPEELLEYIYGQDPYFRPGTVGEWHYSNTNYVLIGMIVERVTGSQIENELRRRIHEPRRLNNTFFIGKEEIPGGCVHGYWDVDRDGKLEDVTDVDPSWSWATVGLVSTVRDLQRFAKALFSQELVTPASLNEMLTFIDASVDRKYGLGVNSFNLGERAWGHLGGIPGYVSAMLYMPDSGIFLIILANQGEVDLITPIAVPVLDLLHGRNTQP